MTLFEVGKPFPGPVPIKEGAIMELWSDGLTVLIQMPDCKMFTKKKKYEINQYVYHW